MPEIWPEDEDKPQNVGIEIAVESSDQSLSTADTSPEVPLDPKPPSAQPPCPAKVVGQRSYLIGKPISASHSPTGRGTKGFIGYDLEASRLVFIKDCWRADARGVHPELKIYSKFKKLGVQYVATAIGGGDVGGPAAQVSLTQDFMDRRDRPTRRIHYRLVLEDVGRSFDTYDDSNEMVIATAQAFIGAGICNVSSDLGLTITQVIAKHG